MEVFEGKRMKTGGRCVEGIKGRGMGKSMGGFDNMKQDAYGESY